MPMRYNDFAFDVSNHVKSRHICQSHSELERLKGNFNQWGTIYVEVFMQLLV